MKRINTMKWFVAVGIVIGMLMGAGAYGCKQDQVTSLIIETAAMQLGYEVRNSFAWDENTMRYYDDFIEGRITVEAAQLAEGYLRSITHPVIARQFTKIAGLVGCTIDPVGNIIGVSGIDPSLLKVAAQGFRQGTLLQGPAALVGKWQMFDSDTWDPVSNLNGDVGRLDLMFAPSKLEELSHAAAERTDEILGMNWKSEAEKRLWMQAHGFLLTDEEMERITPRLEIR